MRRKASTLPEGTLSFLNKKEESSFSEEKEAKRLSSVKHALVKSCAPGWTKVFCFFFSKKKNLPYFLAGGG